MNTDRIWQLELKQDLKEKTRLLEESKSAVKHWSDQLGKLKLNDIDEFVIPLTNSESSSLIILK